MFLQQPNNVLIQQQMGFQGLPNSAYSPAQASFSIASPSLSGNMQQQQNNVLIQQQMGFQGLPNSASPAQASFSIASPSLSENMQQQNFLSQLNIQHGAYANGYSALSSTLSSQKQNDTHDENQQVHLAKLLLFSNSHEKQKIMESLESERQKTSDSFN